MSWHVCDEVITLHYSDDNGRYSVSNHQPRDCLLNRLFRHRSKKTSKFRVAGLCAGISPETAEFQAQMASNAEKYPFDDVIMPMKGLLMLRFDACLLLGGTGSWTHYRVGGDFRRHYAQHAQGNTIRWIAICKIVIVIIVNEKNDTQIKNTAGRSSCRGISLESKQAGSRLGQGIIKEYA